MTPSCWTYWQPMAPSRLSWWMGSLRMDMRGLLDQLPDLQGRVLKMRYGIDCEEPMSLSSIARSLEMSRDRARSLERKAHEELRRRSEAMHAYLAA